MEISYVNVLMGTFILIMTKDWLALDDLSLCLNRSQDSAVLKISSSKSPIAKRWNNNDLEKTCKWPKGELNADGAIRSFSGSIWIHPFCKTIWWKGLKWVSIQPYVDAACMRPEGVFHDGDIRCKRHDWYLSRCPADTWMSLGISTFHFKRWSSVAILQRGKHFLRMEECRYWSRTLTRCCCILLLSIPNRAPSSKQRPPVFPILDRSPWLWW
jgi:hypothetical protein